MTGEGKALGCTRTNCGETDQSLKQPKKSVLLGREQIEELSTKRGTMLVKRENSIFRSDFLFRNEGEIKASQKKGNENPLPPVPHST